MNLKTIFGAMIAIILLTLAACGSPAEVQVQDDLPTPPPPAPIQEPAPVEPVEENIPPGPEEVPEPEVDPDQENSKEVDDLLSKADLRVKSYSYTYQGPPETNQVTSFFVKGDLVRLSIPKSARVNLDGYYDTVYLDTKEESAVGYCLERSALRCPDNEKEFSASYSDFFRRTPYQWISMVGFAEETDSQMIDSRNTIGLLTTIDGKDTTLWVDTFTGLPLQVEQGGDVIEFRQLIINKVTDDDVTP